MVPNLFDHPDIKSHAIEPGRVKLPKIGWVRMRMSRPLPEGFTLKQARIVNSGYFAMLTYQLGVATPDVPLSGHLLEVDIGLDKYLATSDGELVSRPRFFKALQGDLKLPFGFASSLRRETPSYKVLIGGNLRSDFALLQDWTHCNED